MAMWQALSTADGGKAALLIAAQASTGSADPESTVGGGVETLHKVAGQPISFGEVVEFAITLEAPNSVPPDPNQTLPLQSYSIARTFRNVGLKSERNQLVLLS